VEAREEIVENLTFSLGFGLTYARSRFVPSEEDFEDTFILQVSPAVVWNTSSNVIDPDDGFRLEGRLDIADFFERYIRVQTSFSHYLRLRRHFVLASHLRLGFGIPGISTYIDPGVRSDEALVLPPTERFQLGGVAGLRGFPDSSLGPLDENGVPTFGDVVMSGTLELRFPILPDFGPGPIRGAYFVEAGQLTTGFSDVELDAFRYTTGIGVRWVAVGLVPVHFDYGLVLDRRPGEAIGGLQFNVGYPF
jgi:outer membrane protein assembly factor BamA